MWTAGWLHESRGRRLPRLQSSEDPYPKVVLASVYTQFNAQLQLQMFNLGRITYLSDDKIAGCTEMLTRCNAHQQILGLLEVDGQGRGPACRMRAKMNDANHGKSDLTGGAR